MKTICRFLKAETVLCAAAALALSSMLLVPPDAAYAGYINWPVLSVLFCLMAVTAGLRQAGLFDALGRALQNSRLSGRAAALCLVALCFFLSALITNDVALITFVPFTLSLFGREKRLIPLLVLETAAANLGSLVTPIGNPQNLYLYTFYTLTPAQLFSVTLPLGGLCLLLTAGASVWLLRDVGALGAAPAGGQTLPTAPLCLYGALFTLNVLAVLKVVDWRLCLGVTAACLLAFDRRLIRKVDYSLLLSFVCFFVLVGNLARFAPVADFLRRALAGREMLVSALASQVISNVPAAAMLAPFTQDWRGLVLGTNIGGLGTLIASMASLITYRFYAASENARRGRYLAVFSAVNFAGLALLLALASPLF